MRNGRWRTVTRPKYPRELRNDPLRPLVHALYEAKIADSVIAEVLGITWNQAHGLRRRIGDGKVPRGRPSREDRKAMVRRAREVMAGMEVAL